MESIEYKYITNDLNKTMQNRQKKKKEKKKKKSYLTYSTLDL